MKKQVGFLKLPTPTDEVWIDFRSVSSGHNLASFPMWEDEAAIQVTKWNYCHVF